MDCILHIGAAKTGSSVLQKILYEARDTLAERGWIYPVSCLWHSDRSHNQLAVYFWDNYLERFKTSPFDEVIDRLDQEILPSGNLVISSEMLEMCVTRNHQNFHHFLALLRRRGFRIKVVYVVRRQDHFVDSQFKQEVRDTSDQFYGSPASFIERQTRRARYADLALLWRAVPNVEEVAVVPYIEGQARPMFTCILDHMGFTDVLPAEIPRVNSSVDGMCLRLKHYLNRYQLPAPLQQALAQRLVGRRVPPTDSVRLTLFPAAARKLFLDNFHDDFVQLNARFDFGGRAWFDAAPPPAALFAPMEANELPAAVERVAQFDALLAEQILDAVRQAPRKQ